MSTSSTPANRNIAGWPKLLGVSVLAFAFTFSLVPLYRIACEKVLGIRLAQGPQKAAAGGAVTDRWVTVQFDGNVNSKLAWQFHPNRLAMRVQPGRQYETTYFARNTSDRAIVGSAAPSIAPSRASAYFIKTECFCFTAQTLAAGETREMPVRFIVNPDLPADVGTITLSYTFFRNDALTARLGNATTATVPRAAP
ncbi:MAG: cytochrome c oxidase assembly protein [Lysobacter sp.]|nr:MAG: cytochrome c oxidase assembly protein [Lysobacter sp.]